MTRHAVRWDAWSRTRRGVGIISYNLLSHLLRFLQICMKTIKQI